MHGSVQCSHMYLAVSAPHSLRWAPLSKRSWASPPAPSPCAAADPSSPPHESLRRRQPSPTRTVQRSHAIEQLDKMRDVRRRQVRYLSGSLGFAKLGPPGLEPGTSSLSATRSSQLSYEPGILIGLSCHDGHAGAQKTSSSAPRTHDRRVLNPAALYSAGPPCQHIRASARPRSARCSISQRQPTQPKRRRTLLPQDRSCTHDRPTPIRCRDRRRVV